MQDYSVLSVLSETNPATYKAWAETLQCEVLLQVYAPTTVQQANSALKKAFTQTALSHPANYRIYDVFLDGSFDSLKVVVVSEVWEKDLQQELTDRTQRNDPMSEKELASFLRNAMEGLTTAAELSIPVQVTPKAFVYANNKYKFSTFRENSVVRGNNTEENVKEVGLLTAKLALPQQVTELTTDTVLRVLRDSDCSRELLSLLYGMLADDPEARPTYSEVLGIVEQLKPCVSDYPRKWREVPSHSAINVLPTLTRRYLSFYNIEESRWNQSIPLRQPIQYNLYTKVLVLSSGDICCNGGCGKAHVDLNEEGDVFSGREAWRSTFVVTCTGHTYRLTDMTLGRAATGIVQVQQHLYVFGGKNTLLTHGDLVSNIRLQLSTEAQWEDRAAMTAPRFGFNPIAHGESVYLCGGWTRTLDCYRPATDTMQRLSAALPESSFCLTYFHSDQLVVISSKYMTSLRLSISEGVEVTQQTPHELPNCSPWANPPPVVWNQSVYSVKDGRIAKYPLDVEQLEN